MDHVMNAQAGKFTLVAMDSPEGRIDACEKEIAATLEKYNCILIVRVAAKE